MDYITLNQQNFDEITSKGVVLVDFWATWCGPCKMMAPNVEEIATEYKGKVTVGKVDVDECQELATRFGIMSIPTLIVFKDGEKKEVLVGYRLKMQIAQVLDKYL
ncbi:thioredoxin [Firmicutes bacterium CAG:475]|jgi:thioredoxin|nr:thioredoxin [Clostridia bacterium]MBS5851181.1 thioredoxin [Bacillota bacterium]CDD68668.1 thioredoxin [Firmicutes bacterium CAG:475]